MFELAQPRVTAGQPVDLELVAHVERSRTTILPFMPMRAVRPYVPPPFASRRETASATTAGFSEPSTSTV